MGGVGEVRGFIGTLAAEKLPTAAGFFVTLSGFTEQARDLAKQAGLTLIDNRDLFERVDKVRRAEICPTCQSPMLLGHSIHGWWFRCVTPRCGGKRDLDKDPGRAVALLTEQS